MNAENTVTTGNTEGQPQEAAAPTLAAAKEAVIRTHGRATLQSLTNHVLAELLTLAYFHPAVVPSELPYIYETIEQGVIEGLQFADCVELKRLAERL